MTYRLVERLEARECVLGVLQQDGPDLIPYQAEAGADFVVIDTMMGSLSLEGAARLCWMAKAEGVYPFVRLPADPWGSSTNVPDRRFAADAQKVLSAGAEGVIWSVASVEEARSLAHLGSDWHQGRPVTDSKEAAAMSARMSGTRLLFPLVESIPALEQLEEILATDGLSGVFLGMTDLSHQMGHPHDYEHPALRAVVEEAVALGAKYGKLIAANTGYRFRTPEDQIERANALRALGVDIVMLQTAKFFMFMGLSPVIEAIRGGAR